jgi:hypothetical protein
MSNMRIKTNKAFLYLLPCVGAWILAARHESLFRPARKAEVASHNRPSPAFRLFNASGTPLNGAFTQTEDAVENPGLRLRRAAAQSLLPAYRIDRDPMSMGCGDSREYRMMTQVMDLGRPVAISDVEVQVGTCGEKLSGSDDGIHYKKVASFPERGYKRVCATYRYWQLTYLAQPNRKRPAGASPIVQSASTQSSPFDTVHSLGH